MSGKPTKLWRNAVTLNVMKASEGGPGFGMIAILKAAGIPARKASAFCGSTSGYVGHVGIEVPEKFRAKACKIAGVA